MITTETPYKLAEIIRDTWPGIYTLPLSENYETQTSSGISTISSSILRRNERTI